MDPTPLMHPVGPEPARVYWVRRAALAALLVLVVVGAAYACSGGGGATPGGRGGGSTTPTPTVATTTTSAKPAAHRCGAQTLRVEAATDAESYPAGAAPHLTAMVRNVGSDPCRLASQPSARRWSVSSGSDQVWSTDDCGHRGGLVLTRLNVGHQVTYAVTWDGHRSEPGCASPGAQAQPGTYRLDVTVDGARSRPVIFHLTG